MWNYKTFEELLTTEFEEILKLRQNIFILEQKSFFEDIDGYDRKSIHIFNQDKQGVWAYCRLTEYDDKIILGRVTVKKSMRGNGSGRNLINTALSYISENIPGKDIEIVAMSYLKDFYKSFGFISISDIYIMDDDPHEDMKIFVDK